MDGFTIIPIQNTGSVGGNASTQSIPTEFSSAPYVDNTIKNGDGIEIVDESVKKTETDYSRILFPLSFLALFASFGYFGYLVFLRIITIEKVAVLTEQFQVLSGNINKNDITEFIALDNSLNAIKQKLSNHTQLAGVFAFVNSNIRTNVQINDYRIESREKEVSAILFSVAPSFRELAEQTEKMTELKTTGAIKDFTITQMALESDGRRIRYTLNLIFDKSKISVTALAAQRQIQTSNTIQEN